MLTKSETTIANILTAAASLFTARNYADVTMDQIAVACSVTKGALYHHFKSHEGGDTLGNELDALVSKDINKHLVLLAKVAYFNVHGDDAGHVVRGWLQATLKF